jgi:glutathione S-transferase
MLARAGFMSVPAQCRGKETAMLTLYSYPDLFGVADNNPYGLKIFAFLKLCGLPFRQAHILDTAQAPRGQLPYITDDDETIGDSDTIVDHLTLRHRLTIDAGLTPVQRDTHLLIRRTLDDLYWVMSFSRWKDDSFWPLFRDAFLRAHPALTEQALLKARAYNFDRYKFQGIGRFEPDQHRCRALRLHRQYRLL